MCPPLPLPPKFLVFMGIAGFYAQIIDPMGLRGKVFSSKNLGGKEATISASFRKTDARMKRFRPRRALLFRRIRQDLNSPLLV